MKVWHPWQLKKIKILGAVLDLPAKCTADLANKGKRTGSAV